MLPRDKVFCDTSFFFASLASDDSNYLRAGEILEHCRNNSVMLYSTWDIISETITLLRYRASYHLAVDFLEIIKPSLFIVNYDDSVRRAAEEIFKKLSKDKRISFCDSISYVVVVHLLDNIPCFTFDRDFKTLGLTVYP
jgi:predicted nucleic acid-binding protein